MSLPEDGNTVLLLKIQKPEACSISKVSSTFQFNSFLAVDNVTMVLIFNVFSGVRSSNENGFGTGLSCKVVSAGLPIEYHSAFPNTLRRGRILSRWPGKILQV